MPTPYITLTTNVAFQEVSTPGYGLCKTAGAFEFASKPEEKIFREPGTGVIRLVPSCFNPLALKDDNYAGAVMRLADFRLSPNTFSESIVYTNRYPEGGAAGPPSEEATDVYQFLVGRENADDEITPLSVTGDLTNLLDSFSELSGLVWAMQSLDMLAPNEGFALYTLAFNTLTGGLPSSVVVAFGGYFAIGQNAYGQVRLYRNEGTQASPSWARVQDFTFNQKGASNSAGLQIAVIPMGFNTIGIYVSEAAQNEFKTVEFSTPIDRGFLYTLPEPYETLYDPATNSYIKTQAAPITIAVQKEKQAYQIIPERIRYKAASFTLKPEYMDQARNYDDLALFAVGRMHELPNMSTTATDVNLSHTNHLDAAFDPDVDRAYKTTFDLSPSGDGVYSPEVWALSANIATGVYTPTTTPRDLSAYWVTLDFELGLNNEPKSLTATIIHPASYGNLLKKGETVRLEIDGETIWEGYIKERNVVLLGSSGTNHQVMIKESFTATDIIWDRLSRASLAYFMAINIPRVVGGPQSTQSVILIEAGNRAGLAGQIRADSIDLETADWGQWRTPNDFKVFSENATPADFIRNFDLSFGIQNRTELSAAWNPGDQAIDYFYNPEYAVDPNEPTEDELPTIIFVLDSSFVTEYTGAARTNAERWDGIDGKRFYKIKDQIEFTIRNAEYNGVDCYASIGSGRAEGVSISVAPDPLSLVDEEDTNFTYGVRTKTYGPNETALASTTDELEIFARKKHDEDTKDERYALIQGEYQPYLNPEKLLRPFCAIIGKNPDGDWVSYGAWKMSNVFAEMDADVKDDDDTGLGGYVDRRFSWTGTYNLEYAGIATYTIGEGEEAVEVGMFTEILP